MENYKNSKTGQETARKYADILHMERPQSEESLRKHPRMTLQNRAKIFSPFAALRGYDEQLAEEKQRTERVTKRILTEEEMSDLSDKLNHQYIDLLNGDGLASDKFWELNRRIREDRKSLGVQMELRKPDLPYTLVNLLREKIITEDDLNQFSNVLQDAVKQLQERIEE